MEASMSPIGNGNVDMKLEAVIIPVSDADRAKKFYASLGWRLDADIGDALRVIQFNPPGSACSVQFGNGLTDSAPGAAQNLLVVSDIERAHDELVDRGVDAEVFHDARRGFNRFDAAARANGPDPERRTYASFSEFRDPDGNLWQLQEVTTRLAGRVDAAATSFNSTSDLADAMRRASVAHGEHEKRIGEADPNWPEWYASYMVAEQSGAELPL
jgi:catechol 2,3-dioxygenase-like lactoylglutathione lyase family enzyme